MNDVDDGLMLNFASGSDAKKPRQTAKARFAQKRSLIHAKQGAAPAARAAAAAAAAVTKPPVVEAAQRDEDAQPSPAKKQRSDPPASTSTTVTRPSAGPSAPKAAAGSAAPRQAAFLTGAAGPSVSARAPPGGVISALFPSHGVLEDPSLSSLPFNAKPYDPTNAPSSGSDFASLGLDPLLVYHLSNKMEIGSHPTSIQQAALPHLLHPGLDRDILIQAQTGSGKTLTYLLPIIQNLLPLCEESFIDRGVGTLAIVLAPTRELARQIYEVLEKLVSLSLSLKEQQGEDVTAIRRTRWLVPGLLSGGSTKNHEKQRLRKGCPILISTPGRLLDHLQNTSSFDMGKCRWLILDEADRLLEMGFEEQLTGIVRAMDGRRRLACTAAREAMPGYMPELTPESPNYIQDDQVMDSLGMTWWAHPRRVVLCSATLDENVQMLAGKTLINPKIVRGGKESAPEANKDGSEATSQQGKFAAPAQLQQHFVATPPKLRLVTLLALLRGYISRARTLLQEQQANTDEASRPAGAGRVIVFMSCTDSVDFHYAAFGGASMNALENDPNTGDAETDETQPTFRMSELVPGVPIFRLHGSMTQQERIKSLKGFSNTQADQQGGFRGSILLCTSVASRGLDLPDVGCVVQLDPPTEGGIEEYLHRVGRTARVGRAGESWLTILPQEAGWVDNVLEANMTIQSSSEQSGSTKTKKIKAASIERVLQDGYGGSANTLEYQSRATDVQLAFERWVLSGEKAALLARRGFLSHVRAYATHSAEEKQYFNVRGLHLGHLAKAFALREAPKALGAKSASIAAIPRTSSSGVDKMAATNIQRADSESDSDSDDSDAGSDYEKQAKKKGDGFELDRAALAALSQQIAASSETKTGAKNKKLVDAALREAAAVRKNKSNLTGAASGIQTDAEARMYAKVRALGKMSKKHGILGAHGTDEFQIA